MQVVDAAPDARLRGLLDAAPDAQIEAGERRGAPRGLATAQRLRLEVRDDLSSAIKLTPEGRHGADPVLAWPRQYNLHDLPARAATGG